MRMLAVSDEALIPADRIEGAVVVQQVNVYHWAHVILQLTIALDLA